LREKSPAGIHLGQLGSYLIAYTFDNLVLIQEVYLAFGWVHVDVNALWLNFQVNIHKGVSALGKKARIGLLYCAFYRSRLDRAVVDEKEDGCPLDMVVCVRDQARRAKTEL
jgi:hypothetical protein